MLVLTRILRCAMVVGSSVSLLCCRSTSWRFLKSWSTLFDIFETGQIIIKEIRGTRREETEGT